MILSGPTFTPAANAPLAGVLQLTTDVNSRVSVLVNDGTSLWERDFYDFGTNHSETLLGFKPGQTNLIQVTVYDQNRNVCAAPQLLTFVTAPLPSDFPTSRVLTSEPSMMEPGYTLFVVWNMNTTHFYITVMDSGGEVVWYRATPEAYDYDVKQLGNGDLFIPQGPPANTFVEINMLGETVQTWHPPPGYPINFHDGVFTDHGTLLYLTDTSRYVSNFPSSDTVSNAPLVRAKVDDDPVVEMSATNTAPLAPLNTWSPLDMLDPTRVTYLTYDPPGSYGVDNEHGNAVLEDTNDNSIIVSLRNQNAVYKFSRTGRLKWILGPPANWSTNLQGTNLQQYLLTPVGTPFEWNYAQHAPMLTPQRTLLVYDDGNYRASPFDPPVSDQNNYSRGVEFSINETNMEVSQVWDSTAAGGDRLYTGALGETEWLPQRQDVLVTYGYVSYINGVHPSSNAPNAIMARIVEYTHDPVPQVVFDLSFFDYSNTSSSYRGYAAYRALRIPDLYAHPANPVTGINVSEYNTWARLEFSADPARTYGIQASTDLKNWTTIGTAVQEEVRGDFEFDDFNVSQFTERFYRVVTH
jgi:arylsulfate sulfotransferase